MQGRKSSLEPQLFVYSDPYAQLPRSPFYDALAKHLDLKWVYQETAGLYADGIGRPSLDPVVFVKLMLVGFFENAVGDSELAFRVADSLTVRRFLGYSLDERPPDRTTILKTRQRWPTEVFEAIFMRVLEQLKQAGLIQGENLATDTVLIDANASMDSLRHRELGCTYAQFVKALYSQDGQAPPAGEVASKDAKRPSKASNADWASSTDPEAAVAVHPDGHSALSYRLDATVDLETGAIVQIGAAPGNVRDSVDLPQRVEEAKENLAELGLTPEAITADRGHHSAENLVEVEAAGVTPIIRQRAPGGEPGFRLHDFTYLPQTDEYECPMGQRLTRRDCARADEPMHYRAAGKACRSCENFGRCTKSPQGRVLRRSLYQGELERNRERVRSVEGKELLGKHRQRAEGPWSYAKLYGGLARINTRGLENAFKQALLQGIGWNLMKLIAHLTGLAPRGKSAAAKAGAGWGPLIVNVCAHIHYFSAHIGHCGALIHLLPKLRLWRRHTAQTFHLPRRASFSRKRLLSQGC